MNHTLIRCAFFVLILAGCNQGTPGGPGTAGKPPTFGQADDTFNLSVPATASSLRQGEETIAMIGIKRAKNFDQDVALQFAALPQGVTIEPANPLIRRGQSEVNVTFKAGPEAPIGDFAVKITGRPTKGGDATIEYSLKVIAKNSFVLNLPVSQTALTQGATETVTIGVSREKGFDQDVALVFANLPTGVTAEPSAPMIKRGEQEASVAFTATPDAALGTFDVAITGHPTQGVDATKTMQLSIVQP